MSSVTDALSCEAIEGNPDFYGLGIRIGVYLQWISVWVSVVVDPRSAQSVYDINSVFVFAILVATMVATFADPPTIQPVETHIMLQFALGFFVTSLSTFGLRLHLLRPASVVELGERLKTLQKATWASMQEKMSPRWSTLLADPHVVPLKALSPFKPYYLSWSGVVWRTATVGMIAVVNIWLWFTSQPNYRFPGDSCDPPFVFMFSKQQLSGPIVGFYKAVSVIIVALIFYPFLTLLQSTLHILLIIYIALYRDLLHSTYPEASQKLEQFLDRINTLLERNGIPLSGTSQRFLMNADTRPIFGHPSLPQFQNVFDFVEFITKPGWKTFPLSYLLRYMVYLGRAKVEQKQGANVQAERRDTRPRRTASTLESRVPFLWTIFVILSIAWFILSIECTLAWNNIKGVHSINNTGQLIPFVIGCVSTSQVMKNVVLLWLDKKYDDGTDWTLEASVDPMGNIEITKVRNTRNTIDNDGLGDSAPTEA
ncbi:hypothetical protein F4818DRAFT_397069 [Hypoxylon cercidicola]|nr:hypothetical protein F4818DRAFT_397069 [Hypoxylon cercidicola]